jgi:dethiobiotin synthetase
VRRVKRVFVTGTDTGVGKTTVACALLAAYARRGHAVVAMKPCETGGGDDALNLAAATGRALDPALVCPYRFPLPASPEAAAAAAGATVDVARITDAFARLTCDADLALVEGAGGLLVPLGGGRNMADLAAALALPLLIVARASLGTVNHTLLTVEAARRRGLRVAGVILSRAADTAGPDEPTNPAAIARHGDVRVLGTLPYYKSAGCTNTHDFPSLASLAEQHLDLDALWAAL